jgi:hypothetical protein
MGPYCNTEYGDLFHMVGVEAPTMGPFVSIVYVPLSCMLNWYRTNVMCLYA